MFNDYLKYIQDYEIIEIGQTFFYESLLTIAISKSLHMKNYYFIK